MFTTTVIDALDGSVIAKRQFDNQTDAELYAEKMWLQQDAYTCVTDADDEIISEFEI